jgi:hypothetical protein
LLLLLCFFFGFSSFPCPCLVVKWQAPACCIAGTVCVVRAMDRWICVGGTGCVQRVVVAQSAGLVQKVDHLLSRPVYTGAHTARCRGTCACSHCLPLR